jgi:hypothetical protein
MDVLRRYREISIDETLLVLPGLGMEELRGDATFSGGCVETKAPITSIFGIVT